MDSSAKEQTNTLEELAHAKEEFISARLSKGERFWKDLAVFVQEELKLLQQEDPVVHATYTYRVKTKKSLRGKIERLQKLGQCHTLSSFENIRWDVAGVRVCLYFPIQKSQVKSFIESHGVFEVIPYSLEQSAKAFRERTYQMKNPKIRPYEERMGYYEADHYCVRLRTDHERVNIPDYANEEIEIQVRTVLMDAWAEIRHDLDYKHILGAANEEELRVLDAIKGSIASCEILQDHLFMLRKQHVKSDTESFIGDPILLRRLVINSMSFEPGLRFLLDEFGSEPDEGYMFTFTKELLERSDIHSLFDFRESMARLIKLEEQPEKAAYARRALSSILACRQYQTVQKWNALKNDTMTLFQFISVLLLYTMDVEDIERRLWAPEYELSKLHLDKDSDDEFASIFGKDSEDDSKNRSKEDSKTNGKKDSQNDNDSWEDDSEDDDNDGKDDDADSDSNDDNDTSNDEDDSGNEDDIWGEDESGDDDDKNNNKDSDYEMDRDSIYDRESPSKIWSLERLTKEKDKFGLWDFDRRASRWYSLLSMVLDSMDTYRQYVRDEEMPHWVYTVSITWHVHEWVATIYQDRSKLDQIMMVVARLVRHFKEHVEAAWNRNALWLCTLAAYLQWWEKHKIWLYTEDWRDWARRREDGIKVSKTMLEDGSWVRGSQVAADIIGVDPIELKHAALYRALLRGRHADEYTHLHLNDEDIDINRQYRCGTSLLGAAAAFGSDDICRTMLARPGANVNLAFSDGLSLMHIAVVRENGAMIEQLASSRDLNLKATWSVGDLNFRKDRLEWGVSDYKYPYDTRKAIPRAPYWSQYDKHENWRLTQGTDKKLTWTALDMATQRCRTNQDLRPMYKPLFDANKGKERKEMPLTDRVQKRHGKPKLLPRAALPQKTWEDRVEDIWGSSD
jgi:ppGpp synthetase/RelA/SpoT-type nucleotidyltranferase